MQIQGIIFQSKLLNIAPAVMRITWILTIGLSLIAHPAHSVFKGNRHTCDTCTFMSLSIIIK